MCHCSVDRAVAESLTATKHGERKAILAVTVGYR